MNSFQIWMLRKIVRFCCLQGMHFTRMKEIFSIVIDETQKYFTEDNLPTTMCFLTRSLEKACISEEYKIKSSQTP